MALSWLPKATVQAAFCSYPYVARLVTEQAALMAALMTEQAEPPFRSYPHGHPHPPLTTMGSQVRQDLF